MHGCPLGGFDDLNRYFISAFAQFQVKSRLTFWTSETASQKRPIANKTIPAISRPVPNEGLFPPLDKSDTAGELRITVGRAGYQYRQVRDREDVQTTQTHKICPAQNPANRKKWDLISSNRVSDPVLRTLKRRKPASRADQIITSTDALIMSLSSF